MGRWELIGYCLLRCLSSHLLIITSTYSGIMRILLFSGRQSAHDQGSHTSTCSGTPQLSPTFSRLAPNSSHVLLCPLDGKSQFSSLLPEVSCLFSTSDLSVGRTSLQDGLLPTPCLLLPWSSLLLALRISMTCPMEACCSKNPLM